MNRMILGLAICIPLLVPTLAGAQSTPHWRLELEPAPSGELPDAYSGCTISLGDGRVMAIGLFDGAESRGIFDTWIWDDGWRSMGTGFDDTPHCWCASSTLDLRSNQPVVVTTNFETDGVRVSRWSGDRWVVEDVPLDVLPPRIQPTVTWDRFRNTLLVTGGQVRQAEARDGACLGASEVRSWSCYQETWSYDGEDWTLLDDGCGPGPYPGCEPDAAAWDPVHQAPRLVDIRRESVLLWEFTDRWELVDESSEFHHGNLDSADRCRDTSNLALDPRNGNWVGFGGIDATFDGGDGDYFGFWGWSARGGWQPFLHEPKDLDPAGQEGARLAYMELYDEFLMFGGHKLNDSTAGTNETWRMTMRRRGAFGGTGTGCCATAATRNDARLLFLLLAFVAFIRRW